MDPTRNRDVEIKQVLVGFFRIGRAGRNLESKYFLNRQLRYQLALCELQNAAPRTNNKTNNELQENPRITLFVYRL